MNWSRLTGFALLALLTLCGPVRAGDWPQWRGPDRNGIATDEPALVSSWAEGGPLKLWEYPAPGAANGGLGCMVVADGRALMVVSSRFEAVATRRLGAGELQKVGWFPEMPTAKLAADVERARLADERAAVEPDNVAAWVDKWLADHLDEEQTQVWGAVVRDRLTRGRAGIGLDGLAKLGQIKDKLFETQEELDQWLDASGIAAGAKQELNAVAVKTRPAARDALVCLDALSGAEIWTAEYPGKVQDYGSSGTPCVAAGRCYFVSSAGWAYCLSLEDGSEIWQRQVGAGSHASFLVADGLAVVPAEELMALDAVTGEEVWKQPEVKSLYSSPVLWRSDDAAYLICNTLERLAGVELATGKVLWTLPGGLYSSATVAGDHLAVLAGDPAPGLSLYRLVDGEAEWLWANALTDRGASPVIHDGYVYAAGSGKVICVNLDTGTQVWEHGVGASTEVASPIVVDGKLITVVAQTRLLMMVATPAEPKVLARADIGVKFSTSPVIAGGKLYLRHNETVACYDVTAPRSTAAK